MIVKDIASVGRRVVVGLATVVAGQDKALHNARRASTEVSRRKVERDEISIYLDGLRPADGSTLSTDEWPDASAQTGD